MHSLAKVRVNVLQPEACSSQVVAYGGHHKMLVAASLRVAGKIAHHQARSRPVRAFSVAPAPTSPASEGGLSPLQITLPTISLHNYGEYIWRNPAAIVKGGFLSIAKIDLAYGQYRPPGGSHPAQP
jgi:hypothetical protein